MPRPRAALALAEPDTKTVTVTDLPPTLPERSPARAALALAIETRDAIAREVAEYEVKVASLRDARDAAVFAYHLAESNLERALPGFRPRPPHWSVGPEALDEFNAWLGTPPLPVGDARAALAVAQDTMDTAKTALEFHEKHLVELVHRQRYRSSDVEKAIGDAIAADPAVPALMKRANEIAMTYKDVFQLVNLMSRLGALPTEFTFWDRVSGEPDGDTFPLTARWAATFDALCSDPDAPLPMPPAA